MKKHREEVENGHTAGGIMGLMDGMFMQIFNVTTDELDLFSELATDEEVEALCPPAKAGTWSYSDRRKALEARNKYIPYYIERYGKK